MDDGCSKRFDLSIAFNTPYSTLTTSDSQVETQESDLHSSYAPTYPPTPLRTSTTLTGDFPHRPQFSANSNDRGQIW